MSIGFFRARFLPLLESAKEDCLKVVVGTKRDLLDHDKREISVEEAIQFSKDINEGLDLSRLKVDPYFETSAKTGYNVEKVFQYLFEYCLPLGGTMPRKQDESGSRVDITGGQPTGKRGCCG